MGDLHYSVEILEKCNVSPPPNSVPTTTIPLSFLDLPWILSDLAECILFYEFPHPTLHFTQAILPQLKQSLSLTLQHFFPLAGSLVFPPLPAIPHILYQDGDYVPLTIAESNYDFARFIKNYPIDAGEFRPLVPDLSHETSLTSSDAYQVPVQVIRPLLAIQLTIFPTTGLSICLTFSHVVGDARTMSHFIKSWASIFKSKNDLSLLVPPFHDREAVIKDINGTLPNMWNQWCKLGVTWDEFANKVAAAAAATLPDKLHATFVLGRYEINKLKHLLTSQFNNINEPPPFHVSTFVATCAFIWVGLIKTKNNVVAAADLVSSEEDDCFYHFVFFADCTYRTEFNVPKTYNGNCLLLCNASVRKSELLGENGLMAAAKAIMKEVKELDNGLLRKAESWLLGDAKKVETGHVVSVASSPKLRVYETDFGWGRPRKSEIVHIDKENGAISLMESRDEEGGVEIGVSLNKVDMDVFSCIFNLGLKNYSC